MGNALEYVVEERHTRKWDVVKVGIRGGRKVIITYGNPYTAESVALMLNNSRTAEK